MQASDLLTGKRKVRGISLPEALDDALLERARAEDRKISTIVKRALVRYLTENDDEQQEEK